MKISKTEKGFEATLTWPEVGVGLVVIGVGIWLLLRSHPTIFIKTLALQILLLTLVSGLVLWLSDKLWKSIGRLKVEVVGAMIGIIIGAIVVGFWFLFKFHPPIFTNTLVLEIPLVLFITTALVFSLLGELLYSLTRRLKVKVVNVLLMEIIIVGAIVGGTWRLSMFYPTQAREIPWGFISTVAALFLAYRPDQLIKRS